MEVEQYKKNIISFEKYQLRKEKEEIYQSKVDLATISRSFEVDGFGYWNSDMINTMSNPKTIIAKYIDENMYSLHPNIIYLIDETNNGFIKYNRGQEIKYDANADNSLFVMFGNDKIGILKSEEFKNLTNKPGVNKTIPLKVMDSQSMSVEKLRDLIGIN